MESSRPPAKTSPSLDDFFLNQIDKIMVDVKKTMPEKYFSIAVFDAFLTEDGIGIGLRLMRYKALFEMLKKVIAIMLKLFSKYGKSSVSTEIFAEIELLLEIKISNKQFKVISTSKPESQHLIQCFKLIIDNAKLAEEINTAILINSIPVLIDSTVKFHAMMIERIKNTGCLINALRNKTTNTKQWVENFSVDAEFLCLNMDNYQYIIKLISESTDNIVKRRAALNFFRNFVAIGDSHLKILTMFRPDNTMIKPIRILQKVSSSQKGLNVLRDTIKKYLEMPVEVEQWTNCEKLYEVFAKYFALPDDTAEKQQIAVNIVDMMVSARGYIRLLDDEKKVNTEYAKQQSALIRETVYQADLKLTQELITSVTLLKDEVQGNFTEIKSLGIAPRKKFKSTGSGFNQLIAQVDSLNVGGPSSLERAAALTITQKLVLQLSAKLKELQTASINELKYLTQAAIEKIRVEERKQKKVLADKLAQQVKCNVELDKIKLERSQTAAKLAQTEKELNELKELAALQAKKLQVLKELVIRNAAVSAPPPAVEATVEKVPETRKEVKPEVSNVAKVEAKNDGPEARLADQIEHPTEESATVINSDDSYAELNELIQHEIDRHIAPTNDNIAQIEKRLSHESGLIPDESIELKYLPVGVSLKRPVRMYTLFGTAEDTILTNAKKLKESGKKLTTDQLFEIACNPGKKITPDPIIYYQEVKSLRR
ncbi:MAG: hypothetical protein V4501_02675 [Pseudomonadota bacterium]